MRLTLGYQQEGKKWVIAKHNAPLEAMSPVTLTFDLSIEQDHNVELIIGKIDFLKFKKIQKDQK